MKAGRRCVWSPDRAVSQKPEYSSGSPHSCCSRLRCVRSARQNFFAKKKNESATAVSRQVSSASQLTEETDMSDIHCWTAIVSGERTLAACWSPHIGSTNSRTGRNVEVRRSLCAVPKVRDGRCHRQHARSVRSPACWILAFVAGSGFCSARCGHTGGADRRERDAFADSGNRTPASVSVVTVAGIGGAPGSARGGCVARSARESRSRKRARRAS